MKNYCKGCGAELRENVNFCRVCGMKAGSNNRGNRRKGTAVIIASVICAIAAVMVLLYNGYFKYEMKYRAAESFLRAKDYQSSIDLFVELGDYKDSREKVGKFVFVPTERKEISSGKVLETVKTDYTIENGYVVKSTANSKNFEQNREGKEVNEYEYQDGMLTKHRYLSVYDISSNSEEYWHEARYTYNSGRVIYAENELPEERGIYYYEYNDDGNLVKCNAYLTYEHGTENVEYVIDYDNKKQRSKESIKSKQNAEGDLRYNTYEMSYQNGNRFSEYYKEEDEKKSEIKTISEIKTSFDYNENKLISFHRSGYRSFSVGEPHSIDDSVELKYHKNGVLKMVTSKEIWDGKTNENTFEFDRRGRNLSTGKSYDKYGNVVKISKDNKDVKYQYQLIGYSKYKERNDDRIDKFYLPIVGVGYETVLDEMGISEVYDY